MRGTPMTFSSVAANRGNRVIVGPPSDQITCLVRERLAFSGLRPATLLLSHSGNGTAIVALDVVEQRCLVAGDIALTGAPHPPAMEVLACSLNAPPELEVWTVWSPELVLSATYSYVLAVAYRDVRGVSRELLLPRVPVTRSVVLPWAPGSTVQLNVKPLECFPGSAHGAHA